MAEIVRSATTWMSDAHPNGFYYIAEPKTRNRNGNAFVWTRMSALSGVCTKVAASLVPPALRVAANEHFAAIKTERKTQKEAAT
jgi:hypothetical protein